MTPVTKSAHAIGGMQLRVASFVRFAQVRQWQSVSADRWCHVSSWLRGAGRRKQHGKGHGYCHSRHMCKDTHSHALYSAFYSAFRQTHLDALRTFSALVWFKVGLSKSLLQVILADLLCLSATETTSTC